MKRRIIAILLCASLFSGLTACTWVENIGSTENTPTASTSSEQTESTTAPEPIEIRPELPKAVTDAQEIHAAFSVASTAEPAPDPYEITENVSVHFENEAETCAAQDGLYAALNKYDVVLFRTNGPSVEQMARISYSADSTQGYQEYTNEVFLFGKRLVVVTTKTAYGGVQASPDVCRLYCYDVSSPANPTLTHVFGQDGSFVGAVTDGSTLYTISNATPQLRGSEPAFPSVYDGESATALPTVLIGQQCDELCYTVAAAYDMSAEQRLGTAALTDRYDHFAVLDSSLYLARDVILSSRSEAYEIAPYSVRDCLSGSYTELLKFDSTMSLQGAECVDGLPVRLAAGDALYLASTVSTSEYSLFTDETYGWTNRLDKAGDRGQRFTALSSDLSVLYQTELPDVPVDNVCFSDRLAVISTASSAKPVLLVTLEDGSLTTVGELPSTQNRVFTDGRNVYVFSYEDEKFYVSKLNGDGSLSGRAKVGGVPYGAVMFTHNEDRIAVAYDGHTRILTTDPVLEETIAVTGTASFAMNDDYLYEYAVSRFHVIDLLQLKNIDHIGVE